jgi:hypothetical protein
MFRGRSRYAIGIRNGRRHPMAVGHFPRGGLHWRAAAASWRLLHAHSVRRRKEDAEQQNQQNESGSCALHIPHRIVSRRTRPFDPGIQRA